MERLVKLERILSGLIFALVLNGCDDGAESRQRILQYDLDQLKWWAHEGSSEDVRRRAKAGLALLENRVDDEAPFIIMADIAYEDVDAVKEGGKGPILGVKFISEVYAEGTLELSDGHGGWIRKVVGDERLREKLERNLRAIVIPIEVLMAAPTNVDPQIVGRELRLSIRGRISNVVSVERVTRNERKAR